MKLIGVAVITLALGIILGLSLHGELDWRATAAPKCPPTSSSPKCVPTPTATPTPAPTPTPTPTPTSTPPPLSGVTFSFSAAGDHSDGADADTRASFESIAADSDIKFHVALGDMSYNALETEWCNYIKSVVGTDFAVELLTGNHEESPSDEDGFIDNFAACLPDRLGAVGNYGHRYYFDYPLGAPLARIILIDPDLNRGGSHQTYCGSDTVNCTWLGDAIDGAKAQGLWTVVGMHKVCLSAGSKGCEIGTALLNFLVDKHVDLVLHAHAHNYQRSDQLGLSSACPSIRRNAFDSGCIVDGGQDGVYARGRGTVIVIQGTFGKDFYHINTNDKELGYFAAWAGKNGTSNGLTRSNGYMKYTISADSLAADFVPTRGGDFTDSFVIQSSP